MKFLIVDTKFAEQFKGYVTGSNILTIVSVSRGANKGIYVCPENSKNEFPQLFNDTKFKSIELSDAEFEPDYDSLELEVDGKYKVLKKEEDYLKKIVKITYVQNGNIFESIENITNETLTKTGYSVDMEQKIREKEQKKRDEIEPKIIDLKNK